MSPAEGRTGGSAALRTALLVIPAVAVAGVVAWARLDARALPDEAVPVVWDRQVCAHCRMHVGDPGFAAQVQTTDGAVLFFDDPGCLFRHLADTPVRIHAVYLHHLREDRWLAAAEVGLMPLETSPMGYGLGAVEAGAAGALSYDEARARVLAGGDRRPAGERSGTATR